MADKNDGRDDEIDALNDAIGVDTAKITAQINKKRGVKETNTPPPPVEDKSKIPPAAPSVPPVDPKNVSDPETIVTGRLKEIFGDQFTNVDELKKANIPASLQELATLRQKNQELETQLAKKPKHNFASDDIAKFNEFARETGIKDANVFNKLNAADLANMPDIDALSLYHVIENPRLASASPQEIRGYFERKYNVDSAKVEAGELTEQELKYNQMDLQIEAEKAKGKLLELKGKIKMPEVPADEPLEGKSKWTPEIEKTQKATWGTVNEKMLAEFSKIPITIKGGKEPIVDFVLPEEAKKAITANAIDYVVSNQMEVNQENVTSVANAMYSDILFTHREEIYHAIFERARSMTEEEYLKTYHNPSPKNNDTPPSGNEPLSDEAKKEKAFQAELNR